MTAYKLAIFGDFKIGQKVSLKKTITEEDLTHFIYALFL